MLARVQNNLRRFGSFQLPSLVNSLASVNKSKHVSTLMSHAKNLMSRQHRLHIVSMCELPSHSVLFKMLTCNIHSIEWFLWTIEHANILPIMGFVMSTKPMMGKMLL